MNLFSTKMKSSPPFTKQTILSLNQQKLTEPKSCQTITSLNHPSCVFETNTFLDSAKKVIPSFKNGMQKGEKKVLETNFPLSNIQARFGWNVTNEQCDVDVSAFLLGQNGKVLDDDWFVFYGQTKSPDKSTLFSTDAKEDREIISIDLSKLNPAVCKIVFVLTIQDAFEKHLNFSMLKNAYVRIVNVSDNCELASFQMTEYYSNVISMMIGELYRHNGIWKFNAIGNGVAKDLAGLCTLYGVQII